MIIALNVKAFDVRNEEKEAEKRMIASKSSKNFATQNLHQGMEFRIDQFRLQP